MPTRSNLLLGILALASAAGVAGCIGGPNIAGGRGLPAGENPLFVAASDREFLWNQVVDAVDDHFRIRREKRVAQVGEALIEGTLETYPQVGSTLFEPWRTDSTAGYEKLHATLQAIRRQATVRVAPTNGGYLVEVIVAKELEDVNRSDESPGDQVRRHDGTIVRVEDRDSTGSGNLGWIPLGRDWRLEQRILADLRARLNDTAPVVSRLPPT